jgi:hypothetical protein
MHFILKICKLFGDKWSNPCILTVRGLAPLLAHGDHDATHMKACIRKLQTDLHGMQKVDFSMNYL